MLFKKSFAYVCVLFVVLFVSGCGLLPPTITVTSIEVDPTTFSDTFYLEEFDLTTIHLIVEMSDGTTQSVVLDETMISSDDLAKLSIVGDHTITINYQGQSIIVDIRLIPYVEIIRSIIFQTDCDEVIDSISASVGSVVIQPTPPTKVGYAFMGWFTVDDRDQPYVFSTMPQEYVTLYAKWHKTDNGISYEILYHEATILSYTGSETTLTLLDEYDSFPITTIAPNVFKNNTILESLTVGLNVRQIGDEAFNNMTHLKYIGLSGKTILIGSNLLSGCTQLETLVLSSQAPYPLAYYFGDQINNVPATLTKIKFGNGSTGFDATLINSPMNQITLELAEDTTKVYNSQFFECQNITSIIIPNNIIEIEDYGFFDSSLENIIFEENSQLSTIGMHAFDRIELEYFIIPETVTHIGYSAFTRISGEIYAYATEKLPNWNDQWLFVEQQVQWSIKDHGIENEMVYVISKDDEAWIVGHAIDYASQNLIIPETIDGCEVTRIKAYAFFQSNIQNIQLGSNVEVIEEAAFREASQLTSVDFGQNSQLHTIDAYAFMSCTYLQSIHFPQTLKYIHGASFDNAIGLEKITFDENSALELIGNVAFNNLPLLKEAYIPKDAVLEQGAFSDCPNAIFYIYVDEQPITWNNSWYLGTSFPRIYWGVKQMGTEGDFDYFINADDEVVIKGQNKDSTQINLVIPEMISGKPVTTIMGFAFDNNTSLSTIELPSTLHSIEERAFSKATSLTTIFIPNSVIDMGRRVFLDCSAITIYTQHRSEPSTWDSSWHGNNPIIWGHLAPYSITYFGYTQLVDIDNLFLGNFQTHIITTDHLLFKLGGNNGYPENITNQIPLQSDEYVIKMIEGDIVSGNNHSLVLTSDGRLLSWGNNTYGQLGDGTTNSTTTPNDITPFFNLVLNETIVDVSSGTDHVVATTSNNRIFCWGRNDQGQLGDNSIVDKYLPTDISHLFNIDTTDAIAQIESASSHTILRTESGLVYSWGLNNVGQLGNGNTTSQLIPTNITQNFSLTSGEKIIYLDTSSTHTLAISNQQNIYSWGNNQNGQLGYEQAYLYPYKITQRFPLNLGEFIIQVAAGRLFSLFLTSSGRLFTCGNNASGQLGANSVYGAIRELTDVTHQFNLKGNEQIINVFAGQSYSMAITSGGSIFGWGYNYNGQISHYGANIQRKPVQITTLFQESIELITETYLHQDPIQLLNPQSSNAIFLGWFLDEKFEMPITDITMPSEDIILYGKWNANMHAVIFDGNGGTLINGNSFQLIADQDDAIAPVYEREGYHFIGYDLAFNAVTENKIISAQWQIKTYTVTFDVNGGLLVDGSLSQTVNHGDGAILPTLSKEGYHYQWTPDPTSITEDITIIAQWQINTYVITFDGDGGDLLTGNDTYTITHGDSIVAPTFEKVGHTFIGFDVDFSQISSDLYVTAQWSINEYTISLNANNGSSITTITQEYGSIVNVPSIPLKTGHQFQGWYQDIDLTNLFEFSTMPDEDLLLYAKWKINQYQIQYYENSKIKEVYAGDNHSFVTLEDGRIFGYGNNSYYEVGGDWNSYYTTPMDITASFNLNPGEEITKMVAAINYSLAITSDGRIFSWGVNHHGQLGDGTFYQQDSPKDISSQFALNPGEIFVNIFGGSDNSLAITSLDRVFTWGENNVGQLGNLTTVRQYSPVEITSYIPLEIGETISQIESAQTQTWILTSNHRLIAWGYTNITQLKDGTPIIRTNPTDVTSAFDFDQNEYPEKIFMGTFFGVILTSNSRAILFGVQHYLASHDNFSLESTIPTDITDQFPLELDEKITSLALGRYHNIVISSNNRKFVWGNNSYGQLGIGTTNSTDKILEVTDELKITNDNIVEYSFRNNSSFGLSAKGDLYAWGITQLLNGSFSLSKVPVRMTDLFDLVSLTHTQDVNYGEIPSITNPSKPGYVFSGWFIDNNYTTLYQSSAMSDQNLQLYGLWSIQTYQVTFNGNGGTLISGDEIQIIDIGKNAKAPIYERDGYLFNGFDVAIDSITSNLIVNAQWLDITTVYYQVTFDGQGGMLVSGNDIQSVLHGQDAIAPTFDKSGFTFIGWDKVFTEVTNHITINCLWAPNTGTEGLQYTLLPDNTYEVSGYTGMSTFVLIPELYQGVLVTSIGENAFLGNEVVENVYMTENIKIIKTMAFEGTINLQHITLPNDLETIGSSAFAGSGLLQIIIPNSVTTMDSAIFYGASNLHTVVLPNGLTTIPSFLFYRCQSLKTIVIPDNVTTIGEYAFDQCSQLNNIIIPNQVVSINLRAFALNSNLTNLTIGSSVTTIGNEAFSRCIGLTDLILPDSLITIGNEAFFGCIGLTDLILPDSLITIGSGAFINCQGLTSVDFGNGVKTIGDFAFNECDSLTSIDLPNSVTRIKYAAYRDCDTLSSITLRSLTPPTLDNVNALPTTNNFIIYVPQDSLALYQAAANWSQYSQYMQPIS